MVAHTTCTQLAHTQYVLPMHATYAHVVRVDTHACTFSFWQWTGVPYDRTHFAHFAQFTHMHSHVNV